MPAMVAVLDRNGADEREVYETVIQIDCVGWGVSPFRLRCMVWG